MELATISEVSRAFRVTTRTLRYYEQLGLLKSTKQEGYAYRTYDQDALRRIQQIVILRKLGIPLKQIACILENDDAALAIDMFKERVKELTGRIESLVMIKEIITKLIEGLEKSHVLKINQKILSDEAILREIDSLALTYLDPKEDKLMNQLSKASGKLQFLESVRIIHVPPCTVAASHYIGENPEEKALEQLSKFLQRSGLYSFKPDARVYGFNHPNPSNERPDYGYEVWVTIPDDFHVTAPLMKKHMSGGMYAAHTITLGNFHEWELLARWVHHHEKYEANVLNDNGEYMGGCLEEHLNYVYHCSQNTPEMDEHQIDLLLPIKLKEF